MKFFIYFLYTAYLLSEISAWRMTTPMKSAVRSKTKNGVTSQVKKVVERIDLINSAYKDGGRNIGHSSRYDASRRFELPALEIKNRPASLVPQEDDKETQLERMAEAVRYHVVDNPKVLEEYTNKRRKKKIIERYLKLKKTKYFNRDVKLKGFHKNAVLKAGSHNSTNILNTADTFIQTSNHPTNPSFEVDGDLGLTNIESTHQPTFTDGDEDVIMKLVRTTEKENNKPRTDEQNHALSAKIYNTNKFEKRTGIKARGMKHKVSVHEDNAHKEDLNDTGPNRLEAQPLHSNNDQVSKIKENKDDNRNVRMTADNLNAKNNNNTVKNEGEKEKKDKQPLQRSGNKNKRKHTTPVHITSRKHKKNTNQEREEGHLKYATQDGNENSHRYDKKKTEKIDNNDKEVKKDKKRTDKGNREKEIDLNNRDIPRYHDGHIDKMEYEWNKRHLQYDKNDNQRYSNDDEWTKKHYDSDKKENNWNKRDKIMNKRLRSSNKKGRRILRDRKLNMQDNIDSDIEKEDAWYLRNEGVPLPW